MTRTGLPAAVACPRGMTGSTGHGNAVVTAGARPGGRASRPLLAFPAAAPALVRRP